jgi:hypothetical protein
VEIIVNDAISQADDFAPLNLGALGSEIPRQAVLAASLMISMRIPDQIGHLCRSKPGP